MEMHGTTLFLFILCAGVCSQWFAWRLNLPAIVILTSVGIALGPIAGLINIQMSGAAFSDLIGFGISIILFTGGMELKLGEYRRVSQGIKRLTILGPPVAWGLCSTAAHYIAGLSWPVAFTIGAILVVTGPTVILPLLQQAKLNKDSTSLLRWEGIVNDPIGVLLAVLTLQYFTSMDLQNVFLGLLKAISIAALLGGGGGWIMTFSYRRGFVSEHLKAPALLAVVLVVYWASNLVQNEAGLLSVTLMGLVIGNANLAERQFLQQFKDDLSMTLLALLFIMISAHLELAQLKMIDWRMILFVVAVMFLVRPITIWLATMGAPISKENKLLLAWIAPRGIVAAATAGLFGPYLVDHGYPDAEKLLPLIFLVVLTTVVVHGFTLGPFARKLGLTVQGNSINGVLIVGASPWTVALAQVLKKFGIDILIVDGNYQNLKDARMSNIAVYYGELLSEHGEHTVETQTYSYLLCATDNDYYNALVCRTKGRTFGYHLALQLPTYQEASQEEKRLTLQQRGYFAFGQKADITSLNTHLQDGWTIQSTTLSAEFSFKNFKDRFVSFCPDWILLGGISPSGVLYLYSDEQPFTPETGWTILYFALAEPEADKVLTKDETVS